MKTVYRLERTRERILYIPDPTHSTLSNFITLLGRITFNQHGQETAQYSNRHPPHGCDNSGEIHGYLKCFIWKKMAVCEAHGKIQPYYALNEGNAIQVQGEFRKNLCCKLHSGEVG